MAVFEYEHETGRKTKQQRDVATKLGLALLLNRQAKRSAAYFQEHLIPAITLKQIRFYFNDNGQVVGYITWALITDEVRNQLLVKPKVPLHLSEWNEGANLFIMDAVAPYGHFRYMKKELYKLFDAYDSLAYCRSTKKGRVYIEVSRRTR